MAWSATTVLLRATLACSTLLPANTAAGQVPAQQAPSIIVELRDPSGQPVKGANGFLRVEPRRQLAALQEGLPAGLPSPVEKAAIVRATSDARGRLRFVNPLGSAGSGMVTTEAGLGALLPRLHSRRAHRVTLQPMAELLTGSGSEPFAVVARADLPNGDKVVLPMMTGRKIRLPAGDYELWAACPDGLIWQRVRLQRGVPRQLSFAGTAQRLQLAKGAHVHPAGIPELSLHQLATATGGGDDDDTIALRGAALAAPLISWLDGIATPARVAPGPASRQPLVWPPTADRLPRDTTIRLDAAAPGDTTVFGLLRQGNRTFRVVAYANIEDGKVRLPACPRGDAWLLLLADDRAPLARPWSTITANERLSVPKGQHLSVLARGPGNLPIADLITSYTPQDQEAAALFARTDARGVADFGLVLGPGTLAVSDPRYENQTVELDRIPLESLPLAIATGATVTGSVTFAGNDKGGRETIVVTLRDPMGNLRPAQRTVVVQPGAPFTFAGLPDAQDFLLTASSQRDGKTWSARRVVHVGGGPITLTLRNEDPQLRPGNGR